MGRERGDFEAENDQAGPPTERPAGDQSALHSSEARLLRAQDLGGIGTWEWDHAANRGDVSASYRRLHGLAENSDPITRETLFAIMHPEDHEGFMEAVLRGLRTGELIDTEYRIVLADGSERWIRGVGSAVAEDGVYPATCSAGIVQDITEQKLTQLRLRERDVHLRLAMQAYQAGSFEWDIQQNRVVRHVSPLDSLPENEGKPDRFEDVLALVHPEDAERFRENVRAPWAIAARDYRSEHRYVLEGGEARWMSERGLYDYDAHTGDPIRLTGIAIDITETRENEERLRESEARFRGVYEHAAIGIAMADLEGRFVRCNPALTRMLGYSKPDLIGTAFADVIHPDDRAANAAMVAPLLAGKQASFEVVNRFVCQSGEPLWVHKFVSLRYDAEQRPVGLLALITDLTRSRQNEAALAESEERFRTLAQSLPALIFIADSNGANTYANAQFCEYTGLSQQELRGDGWLTSIHPQDRERAAQTWLASWRDQRPYEAEYRFCSIAGTHRTFLVRGNPVRDSGGFIIEWVGTCTDIEDAVELRDALARSRAELEQANAHLESQIAVRTAELVRSNRLLQAEIKRREAAQAALIQGQKLEALGQLASGIAHDFNNLLAAISGGLSMIERRLEDEKLQVLVGHCQDAAFKGAKLVKQMLSFARQEVLEPSAVDLAKLAADVKPLITQAIPGNIVLFDVAEDLPRIMVDPVLLETALLNLAVNARDAMPGGGKLLISAALSEPGSRSHPAELAAISAVSIAVSDNGSGMPPEVVQRVTEPFFTTKATGAGTGLGLAMVFGFVTQSGGAMRIKSRPGKGTTVTLYLPTGRDGEGLPVEVAEQADGKVLHGSGTILLVDDDPSVLAVTAAQLRDVGFCVFEAEGYEAALALCTSEQHFDCVISDVVMPGGDGIALAVAIRADRPDLPCLFMTGRADSDRVTGETVIQKPFRLADLVKLTNESIGRPALESATIGKIAARAQAKCISDMLGYWRAAKIVGKVPDFASFDPDICSEPHKLAVVKADTGQLPIAFEVIDAGAELEAMLGRPLRATRFDIRGASGFGSIEESYRRCVKTQLPVFDYMRMDFGQGVPERFERVILPYSSDGRRVDRLVSVVVFAEDAEGGVTPK